MKIIYFFLMILLLVSCEKNIPWEINTDDSSTNLEREEIQEIDKNEEKQESTTFYRQLGNYFHFISQGNFQEAYNLKYEPEMTFYEFKKVYQSDESEEFIIDNFQKINNQDNIAEVEVILFNKETKQMTKYISIFEMIDNKLKTLDTKVVTHEVLDAFIFDWWKAIVEWNKWKKNLFIDTNGDKKLILSREIQYDNHHQRYDWISMHYTFSNFELIANNTTLLFEANQWEMNIYYTYNLYDDILLWPFYNYENALEWKYDNVIMMNDYYNALSSWKFEKAYNLKYQPNISFEEFKTKYSDYENYEYFIVSEKIISENLSDFEIVSLHEVTWKMEKFLVRIKFYKNSFDTKILKIINKEVKETVHFDNSKVEVIWENWKLDLYYISDNVRTEIFSISPEKDINTWKYTSMSYYVNFHYIEYFQNENKITFTVYSYWKKQQQYEYFLDTNTLKQK